MQLTLLILLAWALAVFSLGFTDILAWYGIASALTFLLYWLDKRKALSGQRRISEMQLQRFAAFGGWPGALLARQQLRHKTQKQPFVQHLYMIVAAHWLGLICYYGYQWA